VIRLELSEEEAIQLATIVANVAGSNVAYVLCNAFEQADIPWDNGLLSDEKPDDGWEVRFR
jgi:hypothetical protein